jgi:hypothetical protein
MGAFASALLGLLPYAISPAHASEINVNSSNVQVVHNNIFNTDTLNMSLNLENDGDGGLDPCDSEKDDLLETGVHISVSRYSCEAYALACALGLGVCPAFDFDAQINYVEHDIGSASYGTFFAPKSLGFLSSKIVALATPANTCGTWTINLQATGQDLSLITNPQISIWLNDSDNDGNDVILGGPQCFDVNAQIGTGIVKPHHGVHSVRHR